MEGLAQAMRSQWEERRNAEELVWSGFSDFRSYFWKHARALFDRASAKGSATAKWFVAFMERHPGVTSFWDDEIIAALKEEGEQGPALGALGVILVDRRKREEALPYLEKAVDQGFLCAFGELGLLVGEGERRDRLWQQGALQGDPFSMYSFGYYAEPTDVTLQYWTTAAELGHKTCAKRLLENFSDDADLGTVICRLELCCGFCRLRGDEIEKHIQRFQRQDAEVASLALYLVRKLCMTFFFGRSKWSPTDYLNRAVDFYYAASTAVNDSIYYSISMLSSQLRLPPEIVERVTKKLHRDRDDAVWIMAQVSRRSGYLLESSEKRIKVDTSQLKQECSKENAP